MQKFKTYKVRQYVNKAIAATFWNVLGTVLPLILCSIILFAYSKGGKIINFIDRGDFCLYSAGLLSGALFVVTDNKENIKNWYNSILFPFAYLAIIVAATLFSAIYIQSDVLKDSDATKDQSRFIALSYPFIRTVSCVLILASLIVTYRSLIIDFKNRPPKIDAIKKQEEEVQNIMGQLGN